jgi:hypothetical protein
LLHPVKPDREGLTERGAGFPRGADEIRDHGAAGFDDAIAHPPHAARVLDAVRVAEAEIA